MYSDLLVSQHQGRPLRAEDGAGEVDLAGGGRHGSGRRLGGRARRRDVLAVVGAAAAAAAATVEELLAVGAVELLQLVLRHVPSLEGRSGSPPLILVISFSTSAR